MTIEPTKYYSPREIAAQGLILGTKNQQSYTYILRLINKGILKSENRGSGKTRYNMVKGEEIQRYLDSL